MSTTPRWSTLARAAPLLISLRCLPALVSSDCCRPSVCPSVCLCPVLPPVLLSVCLRVSVCLSVPVSCRLTTAPPTLPCLTGRACIPVQCWSPPACTTRPGAHSWTVNATNRYPLATTRRRDTIREAVLNGALESRYKSA